MAKAVFNSDWLKDEACSPWLQECKNDRHSAFCFLCKKTVALSNMGVQALKSLIAGKKHCIAMASKISTLSIRFFTESTVTQPTKTEDQAFTKHLDVSNGNQNDEANRIISNERKSGICESKPVFTQG